MKLTRLELDPTEDYAFSVWGSPDGKTRLEREMPYPDYLAGLVPARPADLPWDYVLVQWGMCAKYVGGLNVHTLPPGMIAPNRGWAPGSGAAPGLSKEKQVVEDIVIVPDPEDPTTMETFFLVPHEDAIREADGSLSIKADRDGGVITNPNPFKRKEFHYTLVGDELTKIGERAL